MADISGEVKITAVLEYAGVGGAPAGAGTGAGFKGMSKRTGDLKLTNVEREFKNAEKVQARLYAQLKKIYSPRRNIGADVKWEQLAGAKQEKMFKNAGLEELMKAEKESADFFDSLKVAEAKSGQWARTSAGGSGTGDGGGAIQKLVSVLAGPRSVFNKIAQGALKQALLTAKVVASSLAIYEILSSGFMPAIKMISNIMKIIGFFFLPLAIVIMKLLALVMQPLASLLGGAIAMSNDKNPVVAFLGLLGSTIIGALGTISVLALISAIVGAIGALGAAIGAAVFGGGIIAAISSLGTFLAFSIAMLGNALGLQISVSSVTGLGTAIAGGIVLLGAAIVGAITGIAVADWLWQVVTGQKPKSSQTIPGALGWGMPSGLLGTGFGAGMGDDTTAIIKHTGAINSDTDSVQKTTSKVGDMCPIIDKDTLAIGNHLLALDASYQAFMKGSSVATNFGTYLTGTTEGVKTLNALFAPLNTSIAAVVSTVQQILSPTASSATLTAMAASGLQGWVSPAGNQMWQSPGLPAPTAAGVAFKPMASGGLIPVTGPYLMHAGETVTKAGMNGGGDINITVTGNTISSDMDVKQIARDIARQMQLEMARRTSYAAKVM